MTYQLIIEPKVERFLKKLKKKNSEAASIIATQILELKKDPYTPRQNAISQKSEAVSMNIDLG
jgi:mRNA-degrading endonuclease RelE of RelBE toxin-antitoxin system